LVFGSEIYFGEMKGLDFMTLLKWN
jgi:hypothetical protein